MINTVYVLQYNADSTEGRGPMLIHSIWSDLAHAKSFGGKQSGVMGFIPDISEWTFREGLKFNSDYDHYKRIKQPDRWDCNNGWEILVYQISTEAKKNDGSFCPDCLAIQPHSFGMPKNKFCGQCGADLFKE